MATAVSDPMLQMPTVARDFLTMPKVDPASSATRPMPDPAPHPAPHPAPLPSRPERRALGRFGERNRWPLSVVASVALHLLGAGAMMLSWSFDSREDNPPPAAMVVELAVMPSSPPIQPSEIPPGPEQVEAAPQPKPLDKLKFDPPPQVDAALKPDFALPVKPQDSPVKTQVAAKEARETTAPQSIQAPVLDKNEAPVEGRNVAPPSDAEQAWDAKVMAKLERNKRYPAAAQSQGQEDSVTLRLVIDRQGRLSDARIKTSRGYGMLDSETLALAARASPFPAPPASLAGAQIVRLYVIDYNVRKRR